MQRPSGPDAHVMAMPHIVSASMQPTLSGERVSLHPEATSTGLPVSVVHPSPPPQSATASSEKIDSKAAVLEALDSIRSQLGDRDVAAFHICVTVAHAENLDKVILPCVRGVVLEREAREF